MATVTFYKTKMNRSNRAYDGAALDNILTAASALTVNITPEVIPDTPFAIISANNDNITASDIVLGGYDYISYSYGGKTWYAFIDDVQALATSVGNFFVYHTVDKWAMCVKYFTATFHMQGAVERAHVNDLMNADSESTSGIIDMQFTTATQEAPYNKMFIKKERSEMYELSNRFYYLYLYIANPREAGITSAAGAGQYWSIPRENEQSTTRPIAGTGLLCVYPAYVSASSIYIVCYSSTEIKGGQTEPKHTTIPLEMLTSSAITGMTLSKIPPFTGLGTGNDFAFGMHTYANIYPLWGHEYLTDNLLDFKVVASSPSDGMPPYLNYVSLLSLTRQSYTGLSSTGVPQGIRNGIINKATTFEDYLSTIPKMNSRIYNPVYYADEILNAEGIDYQIQTPTIHMGYTPDLKYLCLIYDSEYYKGGMRRKYIPNDGLFAPDVTIDYWTKLNAEQTGLQAQSNKFNAISGAVFSPIKGAIGGGIAGTATQGKKQSNANFNLGIAGAAVGAVSSTVSGVGNAVYAVQSANNMQEIADRQYNCGETDEYNSTGVFTAIYSKVENFMTRFTCDLQFDVIAPNLHRMGYNTFLQIDEIYNNHKRKYFNYFKGANVSVSGMPQNWSEDIENMFNNGVTLWQSDVENYARLNYPQNTGW